MEDGREVWGRRVRTTPRPRLPLLNKVTSQFLIRSPKSCLTEQHPPQSPRYRKAPQITPRTRLDPTACENAPGKTQLCSAALPKLAPLQGTCLGDALPSSPRSLSPVELRAAACAMPILTSPLPSPCLSLQPTWPSPCPSLQPHGHCCAHPYSPPGHPEQAQRAQGWLGSRAWPRLPTLRRAGARAALAPSSSCPGHRGTGLVFGSFSPRVRMRARGWHPPPRQRSPGCW